MMRVAIVEHNTDLFDYFALNLSAFDCEVVPLPGDAALDTRLAECKANVLVFDSDNPRGDGLSTVRGLRRTNPRLGIVILMTRSCTDEDRIRLLEQGADACLPKPVDIRELAAVIVSVARRFENGDDSPLIGEMLQAWSLVASQLEVIAPDGTAVPLSHNEFCVMRAAARAKGNLLSRKTLIESMGKRYLHYDERCLEALMSRLRRKLASSYPEKFPLRAVRGHGYVFGVRLKEIGIMERA